MPFEIGGSNALESMDVKIHSVCCHLRKMFFRQRMAQLPPDLQNCFVVQTLTIIHASKCFPSNLPLSLLLRIMKM